MESKFDPNAKVKAGDLGTAPDGKQPNQEPKNIDFSKHAPRKVNLKNILEILIILLNQVKSMYKILYLN